MKNRKLINNYYYTINPFELISHSDNKLNNIWCIFRSDKLKKKYLLILKNINQKKISIFLSKRLKLGRSTIERYFIKLKSSRYSCSLPLSFVKKLCEYLGVEILITKLYIPHNKSMPIKSVNCISIELAEILGAFAADGYFHKSRKDYYIKISEGNKE